MQIVLFLVFCSDAQNVSEKTKSRGQRSALGQFPSDRLPKSIIRLLLTSHQRAAEAKVEGRVWPIISCVVITQEWKAFQSADNGGNSKGWKVSGTVSHLHTADQSGCEVSVNVRFQKVTERGSESCSTVRETLLKKHAGSSFLLLAAWSPSNTSVCLCSLDAANHTSGTEHSATVSPPRLSWCRTRCYKPKGRCSRVKNEEAEKKD